MGGITRFLRSALAATVVVVMVAVGCGSSDESPSSAASSDETTTVAPTTSAVATTVAEVAEDSTTIDETDSVESSADPRVALGESFVDAFYEFEPTALEDLFVEGQAIAALYYQGFAEAANYRIVERVPCIVSVTNDAEVICPVATLRASLNRSSSASRLMTAICSSAACLTTLVE